MIKSTLIAVASMFVMAQSAMADAAFIESKTDALLTNDDHKIVSTLNVGYATTNLIGSVGMGYVSDENEPVLRGEIRYGEMVGKDLALEAELEMLYGTNSRQFMAHPELRLRHYF